MHKVLLIHPDFSLREKLVFVIKHSGFHVVSSGGGEQALSEIYRTHPDLIVIAESTGKLNGDELCILIRELCHTPILILGQGSEEVAGIHFLEMGADAYLPSPLDLREFFARIRSLLRRHAWEAGDRSHSTTESGVLHQEVTN